VLQGANTTESYTYDPVGNRLSSLSVSPYSYNASNELTSTPNATYGYDLDGNAVTKNDSTGITTYAWDFENRLTSVTLPAGGGTVTFAYDPFGRRIEKASSAGTSIYAYDGDNLVEETNSSGAVVARYSQGLNIDEPLAMLRSGATDFYEVDGLGSVTSLTSTAGALAQTYAFGSFGKQTASSGSLTNPFQYTGREFDPETSLYYYRARYYDPSAGRFLSEDPIQFGGGPNFYVYVGNGPIGRIDPLGLDWLTNLSNFSAGAGSVLSFGLTDLVNDATGASSVVNKCSISHKLGAVFGIALSAAIGGAVGAEAAEANAGKEGFEFSHWIPDRWGGPRSVWNGNYVSTAEHALNDPFRYRFMDPAWKALNPMNPAWQQQWNRIPLLLKGAGAGAGAAGASAALNCGCN